MRLPPLLLAALAAATAAADTSIPAPASPHTPLGPRCDAAIAAAQQKFSGGLPGAVKFHVRERRVMGRYQWSDMCGVWGDYIVELAPDLRPASPWRWKKRRTAREDVASEERIGTRRARGFRATIRVEGDSVDWAASKEFIDAFRPALDACLDNAPGAKG